MSGNFSLTIVFAGFGARLAQMIIPQIFNMFR
jgi:hypothetical protein